MSGGADRDATLRWHETWLPLVLFGLTVLLAVFEQWSTRDLVWSLWISSLTLGYSFIVISIVAGLFRAEPLQTFGGDQAKSMPAEVRRLSPLGLNLIVVIAMLMFLGLSRHTVPVLALVLISSAVCVLGYQAARRGGEDCWADSWWARLLTFLPIAVFMLGFFTVHFGGFHFVHGLFLNGFFPLVEGDPFGESPAGVAYHFGVIVRTAVLSYWPFVLASAASRLGVYARAVRQPGDNQFFLPYKNVIRMHLMIFVFAGLHAAHLADLALYPVLLFYFFPLGAVVRRWRVRSRRQSR